MSGVGLKPTIGYDNLLLQGTVTANGSNGANAYDWFQDSVWTTAAATGTLESNIGSSVPCDYYAISTHNLYTRSATVKLQYWTGAAYSDVAGSSRTPTSNDCLFVPFFSVSATKFQLVVTTDGTAATLGVVSFGKRLDLAEGLQNGYTPPRFARRDDLYNNMSQNGKFIGRSLVSTGVTGDMNITNVDEEWMRINMDPFITASRTQGWFLLWNPLEKPLEAAYCWTTATPAPQQIGAQLTSIQITYEGTTT